MTVALRAFYPQSDWFYIQRLASPIQTVDTCGVTAFDNKTGQIYGCIIFDNFAPNSAQCHVGMTHPYHCLKAKLLHKACEFVFIQCNRSIAYALVPSSNKKSQKFTEHVGFTEKIRLKDGFDLGVDYVVYELKRRDCRFLVPKRDPVQLELFIDGVKHG